MGEQQDVVIDAQDVLAGWVSPHHQIACTCSGTAPTMPTYRNRHLNSCPLAPLQALVDEYKRLRTAAREVVNVWAGAFEASGFRQYCCPMNCVYCKDDGSIAHRKHKAAKVLLDLVREPSPF